MGHRQVYLAVHTYPEQDAPEIYVYSTRAKARRHAWSQVQDYVKEGVQMRQIAPLTWESMSGNTCVYVASHKVE